MDASVDAAIESAAKLVLERIRAGEFASAWTAIDEAVSNGSMGEPAVSGPTAGFREIGGRIYWKAHALSEYVALQNEQVRRLEVAIATTEGEERETRVATLVGALFNLASFTWPGWEEPEIMITHEALLEGSQAAKLALTFRTDPAHKNAKFGVTIGMAHWIVGAHALIAREWATAHASFAAQGEQDRQDGDDALAKGYAALTTLLKDQNARGGFESIVRELNARGDEDSVFIRDQLLTARRVMTRRTREDLADR